MAFIFAFAERLWDGEKKAGKRTRVPSQKTHAINVIWKVPLELMRFGPESITGFGKYIN